MLGKSLLRDPLADLVSDPLLVAIGNQDVHDESGSFFNTTSSPSPPPSILSEQLHSKPWGKEEKKSASAMATPVARKRNSELSQDAWLFVLSTKIVSANACSAGVRFMTQEIRNATQRTRHVAITGFEITWTMMKMAQLLG